MPHGFNTETINNLIPRGISTSKVGGEFETSGKYFNFPFFEACGVDLLKICNISWHSCLWVWTSPYQLSGGSFHLISTGTFYEKKAFY